LASLGKNLKAPSFTPARGHSEVWPKSRRYGSAFFALLTGCVIFAVLASLNIGGPGFGVLAFFFGFLSIPTGIAYLVHVSDGQ